MVRGDGRVLRALGGWAEVWGARGGAPLRALPPFSTAGAVPGADRRLGPGERRGGDHGAAPAAQRVAAAEPPAGARWRQDSLLAGHAAQRQPHPDPRLPVSGR